MTNDQGGTDDAIATIVVNGAPSINISMPTDVRAGDAALLDASASYDPEGDELTYSWDLNAAEDSDGDGDAQNDADATTPTVLLDTSVSGIIKGVLRVDDAAGAFAVKPFEVNVTTRTFQVTGWKPTRFRGMNISTRARRGLATLRRRSRPRPFVQRRVRIGPRCCSPTTISR